MDFIFANLFPILLIFVFVISGIVRLILRKKRLKKGKVVRDVIENQHVKPDDERKLKFERIKRANFVDYPVESEERSGGIGILEGKNLNEEKLDTIKKRMLKGFKVSDFSAERLGHIVSSIEPAKNMGWDKADEREEVKQSFISKLNKLKPFARAIVWKEILDKPKSENF